MKPTLFMLLFGLYILLLVLVYYLIFHKHHKRNKIELFELLELFTNFFVTTTISIILIAVGIYLIKEAHNYRDSRNDVIVYLTMSIAIMSGSIINYFFFIKRNLKDFDPVLRANFKKRISDIGEILELVIFGLMAFSPIIGIPKFISVSYEKGLMIKYIIISVLLSISSIFLLYEMNPCNIKNKILKKSK